MSLSVRNLLTWVFIGGLNCFLVFLATQSTGLVSSLSALNLPLTRFPTTRSPTLLEAIKSRRTYYALDKILPVSNAKVIQTVEEVIQVVPSAFNSQTNRVVVLFGSEHDKLWDMCAASIKDRVSEELWEATNQKMAGFKGAAGTILFFVDEAVVNEFASNISAYADKFPGWATHSDGMLQFAVWTALEDQGLGTNLQHYNPLIDVKVAETWQVPSSWQLSAQLVFGGRAGEPGKKSFKPLEEKCKVFGA